MPAEQVPHIEPPDLPTPQGLSDAGLVGEVRRAQREACRWEARRTELIAEAERRGLARREGFGSTTAWLMAISGDPAAVCRSRVAVAAALEEMPQTREAFAAGAISEPRVRLLACAQGLAPEQFAQDEAALVAQAVAASAPRLPRVLGEWRRRTDPAGAEGDAERQHGLRALHVSPAWSGMVHLSGDLDPEGGAFVLAALRSLSEPAALDPADLRTPAQCRADALVEICHRYLDGGPGSSEQRPHLTVTIPWESLRGGSGGVDTETGSLTAHTVRRLACDASVSRAILDADSVPLEVGRARRVVPPALRRSLELRDQGCTHPGCPVPPRWCDAHHLRHWADGGSTGLANLRLLCRRHHRQAHDHQAYRRRE